MRARASLAEEQCSNAERTMRHEAARDRLLTLQVSNCNLPTLIAPANQGS